MRSARDIAAAAARALCSMPPWLRVALATVIVPALTAALVSAGLPPEAARALAQLVGSTSAGACP